MRQHRRARFVRPNNTAFAVKIKLEQKDLSPPLFIEEVSRSDGGVFKSVLMVKVIVWEGIVITTSITPNNTV